MPRSLLILLASLLPASAGPLLISQYTETDSGTTPKGIEVLNAGGQTVVFSATNELEVQLARNGAALAPYMSVSSGSIPPGGVLVLGTEGMNADVEYAFNHNGDDALAILLGGVLQDVFGQPGTDPGSAWTGGGVSTQNRNIQLKPGILTGDLDGWSDPSERFEDVGPGRDLTGFGVPPDGFGMTTSLVFAASGRTVAESAGAVTVTVVRSVGTGTASVQFQVGGTATLDADVHLSATGATFAAGQTEASVIATVQDDPLEETAETLVLTLEQPVGGVIGTPSVYTLTISASDAPETPPVLTSIGDRSVLAGDALSFPVTATATDGDPVTLTASNLPAGASFLASGATGTFTWASAGPPGAYPVVFTAGDDDGQDVETVILTVTTNQLTFTILAANLSSQTGECDTEYGPTGSRLFQGLKPDIVGIQEWNVTNAGGPRAFVDAMFGAGFDYYREPEGYCSMPNGIISRWPILAAGEWNDVEVFNRDFAWATIDLPGDLDLHVVSVHFKAGSDSADVDERERQARSLTNYLAQLPPSDYIAVVGDLNIHSTGEAAYQIMAAALRDDNKPVDRFGDRDTNIPQNRRYDYVLPNDALQQRHADLRFEGQTFPDGLVFESSQWSPPPSPVLSGDSTASGIQHLGVMKAYTLAAADDPGPSLGPLSDRWIGVGTDLTFPVTVSSGDGSPVTLTMSNLPAGAVFAALGGSGTFAWSNASPAGVVTVRVHAVNGAGTDEAEVVITVSELGAPLDVSGYVIRQFDSAQSFTLPPGTEVAPGGLLVVGRDVDQAAFEAYWGVTLGGQVTYVNSSGGMPLLNGDETYQVEDGAGTVLDGPTGRAMQGGDSIHRTSVTADATLATSWTRLADTAASPGSGAPALEGTGNLVITEVADASGTGNFPHEFIELLYDPAGQPDPDSDGDGLEDAWELANFGGLGTASFGTDSDGDTVSDGHEWIAGTQPTNALSFLAVDGFALQVAGPWEVTWAAVSGRAYRVLSRVWTNPGADSVAATVTARNPVVTVTLPALPEADSGYLYLSVE